MRRAGVERERVHRRGERRQRALVLHRVEVEDVRPPARVRRREPLAVRAHGHAGHGGVYAPGSFGVARVRVGACVRCGRVCRVLRVRFGVFPVRSHVNVSVCWPGRRSLLALDKAAFDETVSYAMLIEFAQNARRAVGGAQVDDENHSR